MQDNNWTADGEFWDEAWADMSKKLDCKPQRRPFVWWPWLGGLVGIAMLIFVVWITKTYDASNAKKEARPPVQSTVVDHQGRSPSKGESSSQLDVHQNQEVVGKTGNEKGTAAKIAATKATFSSLPILAAKTETDEMPGRKTESTPTLRTAATTTSQFSVENPETNKAELQLVDSPPKTDETSRLPDYDDADTGNSEPEPELIVPVSALPFVPSLDLGPVAEHPEAINFAENIKSRGKFQRYLSTINGFVDAGLSASTRIDQPGYYLGLGLTIPVSKKLSIPVGIRFRQDQSSINSISLRLDSSETTISNPVELTNAVNQNLISDLRLANLAEVRTQSVEFRAGIAFQASKRFSFGGTLGLQYLDALQGPQILDADGREVLDISVDGNFLSRLTSESATLLDRVPSGGNAFENERAAASNNFNRWLYTSEIYLQYDLSPRLGLNLNLRTVLTEAHKEGLVDLAPVRLGIGARYLVW